MLVDASEYSLLRSIGRPRGRFRLPNLKKEKHLLSTSAMRLLYDRNASLDLPNHGHFT